MKEHFESEIQKQTWNRKNSSLKRKEKRERCDTNTDHINSGEKDEKIKKKSLPRWGQNYS